MGKRILRAVLMVTISCFFVGIYIAVERNFYAGTFIAVFNLIVGTIWFLCES